MWQKLKQHTHNFLRWSEKYTKTDMVYLAKGGSWLGLSKVVSSLCSLILAVAFANLISVDLYGKYRYVVSIISILTVATFPGMSYMAIKSVANDDEGTFWKLVKKKALWSLSATVAGLFLTLYYYLNGNDELASVFVVAALIVPFSYTFKMYAAFLNGKKDWRRLTYWSTLARIAVTISIIVALPKISNLFPLILLYFVPELIIEGLFLRQLYKESKSTGENKTKMQKFSHFGFHASLMEIIKTIASQIDKILIFHYLGTVQLATYTIATTAPGQIKGILQNISTLAWPKFSSAKEDDTRATLPAKLLKLELIILGIVVLYWIVAPFLFPFFFPKYATAVFLSQIFSLSLLFFPRTFLSTAMTAHLKQKEMYAVRIIAPVIRITIFAVVLPVWGLWGAIIGSIVSNALTATVYQYFFRRAFPKIIT